ncbi:MAG: methyltransferase domain-containing protein [Desulfatitalea sp.]
MNESKSYQKSIAAHYQRSRLSAEILDAVEKAGKQIASYQDATTFDQFHIRGLEATRELAVLAGVSAGHRVLDLGCGIGGASRLLAAEFGCHVTGVDIMDEFVETATLLTRKSGLHAQVTFQKCNITELPFDDDPFDGVWSQHTLMNIEDKHGLFGRILRLLKPGGVFAFNEIMAGTHQPVHYPVQWASDPSINFLLPEDRFRLLLDEAGFEIRRWQDVTVLCRDWFQQVVTKMARRSGDGPAPLGLNLVIGPTAAEKARNTLRNLEEDRIRVVYGVACKRPSDD